MQNNTNVFTRQAVAIKFPTLCCVIHWARKLV